MVDAVWVCKQLKSSGHLLDLGSATEVFADSTDLLSRGDSYALESCMADAALRGVHGLGSIYGLRKRTDVDMRVVPT